MLNKFEIQEIDEIIRVIEAKNVIINRDMATRRTLRQYLRDHGQYMLRDDIEDYREDINDLTFDIESRLHEIDKLKSVISEIKKEGGRRYKRRTR